MFALAAPAAHAHGDLEASTPSDGETVTTPLTEVTFRFNQPVEPFVDGYVFTTFLGEELLAASVDQPDPRTVVARPAEPITEVVRAQWAIVSTDSHPVTGSVVITVDIPPTPTAVAPTTTQPATAGEPATTAAAAPSSTTPAPTSSVNTPDSGTLPSPAEQAAILSAEAVEDGSSTGVELLASIVRWVTYVATALLVAAAALALARRDGGVSWDPPRALTVAAAVALTVAAVAAVGSQLSQLTGDVGDAFSFGDWSDVFSGRFRTGIVVRLVAGLALLVAAVRPRLTIAWAAGAVGALVSYPILSHLIDDGPGWLAVPAQLVHIAAISIWAGGLVLVVLAIRSRCGDRGDVVARFSRAASVALGATAVTGAAMALIALDAPSDLRDTSYGNRLVAKLALVCAVAAIGARHRFVTVPRLAEQSSTTITSFVRLAWVEIALFGAVLAATAWLIAAA